MDRTFAPAWERARAPIAIGCIALAGLILVTTFLGYRRTSESLVGGSSAQQASCIATEQCQDNKPEQRRLFQYCASNKEMCRTYDVGQRELICIGHDDCVRLLASVSGSIGDTTLLLNSYFVGLCVAVGFLIKLLIDRNRLPDRVQLFAFAGFIVAAYGEIFSSYWVRVSIALQLAGAVRFPSALHAVHMLGYQAGAEMAVMAAVFGLFASLFSAVKSEAK